TAIVLGLAAIVANVIAYLFSQGASISAVSELYLGRATSIGESLKRVWDDIGSLFGAMILNFLAIAAATVLFIIPGIYVACRLLVWVPSVLIERRSPRDSLSRSFDLTRGAAGHAFLILALYFVLGFSAALLFEMPLGIAIGLSFKDPVAVRLFSMLAQVGS